MKFEVNISMDELASLITSIDKEMCNGNISRSMMLITKNIIDDIKSSVKDKRDKNENGNGDKNENGNGDKTDKADMYIARVLDILSQNNTHKTDEDKSETKNEGSSGIDNIIGVAGNFIKAYGGLDKMISDMAAIGKSYQSHNKEFKDQIDSALELFSTTNDTSNASNASNASKASNQ
jgi:hypothetical protein